VVPLAGALACRGRCERTFLRGVGEDEGAFLLSATREMGELFVAEYQSGAASSFFSFVPRGSMLQNSRVSFGFSTGESDRLAIRRENRIAVLSGIVVGQLSQQLSVFTIEIKME
jgi:Na+-driven multidrug efflux pump